MKTHVYGYKVYKEKWRLGEGRWDCRAEAEGSGVAQGCGQCTLEVGVGVETPPLTHKGSSAAPATTPQMQLPLLLGIEQNSKQAALGQGI